MPIQPYTRDIYLEQKYVDYRVGLTRRDFYKSGIYYVHDFSAHLGRKEIITLEVTDRYNMQYVLSECVGRLPENTLEFYLDKFIDRIVLRIEPDFVDIHYRLYQDTVTSNPIPEEERRMWDRIVIAGETFVAVEEPKVPEKLKKPDKLADAKDRAACLILDWNEDEED